MSEVQQSLVYSGVNEVKSITFTAFEVDFFTDAIGIRPRVYGATCQINLDSVKDISSWDRALAQPFFTNSYLYFVSAQDRDMLPFGLKAIFELQSGFFDQHGIPLLELFAKGSFTADYIGNAFQALLRMKREMSTRVQALAYFTKGLSHEYGIGCGVNKMKSKYAYRKAADLGDVRALLMFGFQKKSTQEYAQAKVYFEKASEQRSAEAMNELGELYYYGLGVSRNYDKAVDLFKKSALMGYLFAIDNLKQLNVALDLSNVVQWTVISLDDEEADVEIEASDDEDLFSHMMSDETLPFKKRPYFQVVTRRIESPAPEECADQESKKQRMCADN